ncbi:MAG TPA: hypothetical protein PKD83_14510, partial [Ignavibacteria bacterium]|nr:hypothetical protein [Ignavibacteria bacterium]
MILNLKELIFNLWKRPKITMPLVILFWGVYYIFFGAIINVNYGFGYDGYFYGKIALNFIEQVFGHQLSFYRIQRILPSFIVSAALSILNIHKNTFNIIKAFQILNLVLLILSSFIWIEVCRHYKLNLKLIWIGFILWFLNFGIAKFTFYYPVLTDTTAFFLGFCLMYFHLKDNLTGKILVSLLGAFTFPTIHYFGALLIVFPINSKIEPDSNIKEGSSIIKKALAFLFSIPFLLIANYYIRSYFQTGSLYLIIAPVIDQLLYISAFINFIVMFFF